MPDWIQAHLPEGGLLVAGLALIKWLVGREVKRIEDRHIAHEKRSEEQESRLRRIEESRITRDDMDELRMSLMASMNLMHSNLERSMGDMQADVRLLTDHLLGRRK